VNHGLDVPCLTVDLEGNPRPQDGGYDIGAFEGVRWEVYLPLVLHNHQENSRLQAARREEE
jgi:hypothetical protein